MCNLHSYINTNKERTLTCIMEFILKAKFGYPPNWTFKNVNILPKSRPRTYRSSYNTMKQIPSQQADRLTVIFKISHTLGTRKLSKIFTRARYLFLISESSKQCISTLTSSLRGIPLFSINLWSVCQSEILH